MSFFRTSARWRAGVLDYAAFVRALAPLLARYLLGIAFVTAGWGKLGDLSRATQYFGSLGLAAPGFWAGLVGSTELVCGGLLLLGLATRFAAIPLMAVMIVALATARATQITGLRSMVGLLEVAYLVLLFYLCATGPGALSADTWVAYRLEREKRPRRPVWTSPAEPSGAAASGTT